MTIERFEEIELNCFNIAPQDCMSTVTQLDIIRATNFVNSRIGYNCGCNYTCICSDENCDATAVEKSIVYYVLTTQSFSPEEELNRIENEVLGYMNSLGIYHF